MQRDNQRAAKQPPLSETDLIAEAQQGDFEAFAELYRRYFKPVHNRVRYRIPAADVEDVTQEVFIEVARSLKNYRGESLFSTWLRTLTNRCIAGFYRRQKGRNNVMFYEMEHIDTHHRQKTSPDTVQDDRLMLQMALDALPEHYQEIILLRFAEGLQFKEIAALQMKSLEATKSMFRRALAALRQQMGESTHV